MPHALCESFFRTYVSDSFPLPSPTCSNILFFFVDKNRHTQDKACPLARKMERCVLICFIKPVPVLGSNGVLFCLIKSVLGSSGKSHGTGASSRAIQISRTHDWESPTYHRTACREMSASHDVVSHREVTHDADGREQTQLCTCTQNEFPKCLFPLNMSWRVPIS